MSHRPSLTNICEPVDVHLVAVPSSRGNPICGGDSTSQLPHAQILLVLMRELLIAMVIPCQPYMAAPLRGVKESVGLIG